MRVVLVGVNHRTAPVELRERLNLAATGQVGSLGDLMRPDRISELAVVSTCNRLEIYSIPAGPPAKVEQSILSWLGDGSGIPDGELNQALYRKRDREAVRHLLQVACGLDSQMLGETQVLGQLSQCFVTARTEETIGPLLTFILSRALHAGKRARAETSVAYGKTSISHAAAALVEQELNGLSGRQVVIIGAGETAAMAVQALRGRGDPHVLCVNRSMALTRPAASSGDCEVLPWSALARVLAGADAAISATSAPHAVLYAEDLRPVLEERGGRDLVLVDIAVPRDIDPNVGRLPGVVLHDIDRLEASLDEGRARREAAVPQVEEIVAEETEAILEWLRGREVAPLIHQLRRRARVVAEAEARRTLRKLEGLDEREERLVVQMARRIANKMIHEPTVRLKAQATNGEQEAGLEMLAEIFGLGIDAGRDPGDQEGGPV